MTSQGQFNPRRFHKLCHELLNIIGDETHWRTTVNRSYLAALMVADEIIRLRGVTTQLGGFYSKIEENLLRVGVDPLIRDLIADLKERRLVADYRYNQHISKKNAEESLQISEYIVKTLDEF